MSRVDCVGNLRMLTGKLNAPQIRSGSDTVIVVEVTANTAVNGPTGVGEIKSPTKITLVVSDAVVIAPVEGLYAVALMF